MDIITKVAFCKIKKFITLITKGVSFPGFSNERKCHD